MLGAVAAINSIAGAQRVEREFGARVPGARRVEFCHANRRIVVREGWEPLCGFLRTAIPDEPFPRTNSREDFWERLKGPVAA